MATRLDRASSRSLSKNSVGSAISICPRIADSRASTRLSPRSDIQDARRLAVLEILTLTNFRCRAGIAPQGGSVTPRRRQVARQPACSNICRRDSPPSGPASTFLSSQVRTRRYRFDDNVWPGANTSPRSTPDRLSRASYCRLSTDDYRQSATDAAPLVGGATRGHLRAARRARPPRVMELVYGAAPIMASIRPTTIIAGRTAHYRKRRRPSPARARQKSWS